MYLRKNTNQNKIRFSGLTAISIGLCLMAGNLTANPDARISYRGYARDVKTGQLLYTENHLEHWKNGNHTHSRVDYRKPNGNLLARKRIFFTRSAARPDFEIVDQRTGAKSGARKISDNLYELYSSDAKGEPVQKKRVQIPSLSVIDGGFDNHIRENFDFYAAGRSRVVAFVSADRRDYFRFRVQALAGNGQGPLVLKMYPENLLLRGLVGTVWLKYDRKLKRLLEYRGISNIENDQGDTQQVVIRFNYKGVNLSAARGL